MQELFSIYQRTNVLHLKSIFGLRAFWFNFDLVYRYNAAIVAKSIVFVYFSFDIYGHLDWFSDLTNDTFPLCGKSKFDLIEDRKAMITYGAIWVRILHVVAKYKHIENTYLGPNFWMHIIVLRMISIVFKLR